MAAPRMGYIVHTLQKIIGYKFKNSQYLWEAVQAPGSIIRSGEIAGSATTRHSAGFERLPDGHRRLAVLGDTVLKLALVEDWYRGREIRERLSRVVSDVGSNANLDMVGRVHGIDALINNSPTQIGVHISPLSMAGTVEAILGAVYLDSGMKAVSQVMLKLGLMPKLIRKTLPKSVLQTQPSTPATETPAADSSTVGHEKSPPPEPLQQL